MDTETLATYFRKLLTSWREKQFQPRDLLCEKEGVVLVGAGKVGQEFLAALRASDIPVLAFSDNDSTKWGTSVSAVPILPPKEAVSRFGNKAVFIITIGRLGEGIRGIFDQFSGLGAHRVLPFTEAIRFLPNVWSHFFLDPDAFSGDDVVRIVDAFRLFCDDKSKDLFCNHLAWRMTLSPELLQTPTYDDQYFPRDIVAPSDCAVFVDIGAYIGDTLVALNDFSSRAFDAYYGFEPDPQNFRRLKSQADEILNTAKGQIITENTAIGASEQIIAFIGDGSPSSHIGGSGGSGNFSVSCKTLDSFKIENPTFVKIDVEGFEHEVLHGGIRTLGKSKPTVAIATYHRPKDLFEIPLMLAEISPDYRFYLRSHGDAGTELVCYAVASRQQI